MVQMNLLQSRDRDRIDMQTPRGMSGDGMDWEIGNDMYTLLCMEQITSKSLLYSPGNCTHCSVVT